MGSAEPKSPSVLGRAFEVLDAFPGNGEGTTLTALARRTGIPKGSLHRLLQQLVDYGALERVDQLYYLGGHIFELAKTVPLQSQLRETALPFMIELYEKVHETIHLGVLQGIDVVYVERLGGLRQVRCPTRVGGRMPAYCTALGKALLANSPGAVVRRVVEAGFVPHTRYTVRLPGMLIQDLERTRERGIAVEHEEMLPGVACVAAPIITAGMPIAAISITGPSNSVSIQRYRQALTTAVSGVAEALARNRAACSAGEGEAASGWSPWERPVRSAG
jgi:DNA-binding IclR family transcriptional regulator